MPSYEYVCKDCNHEVTFKESNNYGGVIDIIICPAHYIPLLS